MIKYRRQQGNGIGSREIPDLGGLLVHTRGGNRGHKAECKVAQKGVVCDFVFAKHTRERGFICYVAKSLAPSHSFGVMLVAASSNRWLLICRRSATAAPENTRISGR